MANSYFNAEYYLNTNPDVREAFGGSEEGAWNHYVLYGAAEGRKPAPWFDAEYYLEQNPDLGDAGLEGVQLFEHFTTYGIGEGRQPSAEANVNEESLAAYAAANADLMAAFDIEDLDNITEEQYEQLASHFYRYGYLEERDGAPSEWEIPDPEPGPDPEPVPGETFWLTSATDRITGTDDNDQFNAYLEQNPWAGGVSNTLSSADSLDGGAGYDSLHAELVPEFFGVTGDNQIDVQPRTTNIEQVEFEARDLPGFFFFDADPIVVDAKHMYGVEKIGSKQSDGDLVIENLTTLANDGTTKRNTSELTITMDHTDNFNSDGDASDLTVYFDDNYLQAGAQTEFAIQLRIVNNFELAENDAPLTGFQTVKFNVGDQEVVVDITEATTYQGVANAINAQLTAQGITGVEANTAPARTSVFSDDVPAGAGYVQGQLAGEYLPINIVSTNQPLVRGPIELESNIENFDGLNTWVDGGDSTTDDPISVNIELTKVGRGGDGGDLVIGAKSLNRGIEQFDVTVKGGDHLPNSLGVLATTFDALDTINIKSETLLGQETFASLEIRDGFGQDSLELVDASAFLGDLILGSDNRIDNLDTLIATGGGDVVYRGISTGGHDTSVTTGTGNDNIDIGLAGISGSGSTPSSALIDAGDGDNVVEVHSWGPYAHSAIITTGSGSDVINGNDVSIVVHTGAGNDVIYAENTGDEAEGRVAAGTTEGSGWDFSSGSSTIYYNQLLGGRELLVTLALPNSASSVAPGVDGFETTVRVEASNGYLTTERDLYEAVARAINDDPVLNKLAVAEVDSNGHFTVEYLVDGDIAIGQDAVHVEALGTWANLSTAAQNNIVNQLKSDYHDSGINATDVGAAYDVAGAFPSAVVEVTASGTNSATNGGTNVVNGGLGDDVIVLSSDASTNDTVVFDAGGFGNDTIVHFTAGDEQSVTGGDTLDFTAWLNNEFSHSSSPESIDRVETTLATETTFTANSVVITDFTTLDGAAAITLNFDTLTGAQVLAALNNNGTYAVVAPTGPNFQGNTQKSILFVENDVNEGEYKVFEVTSGIDAGNNEFTGVTLVGSVDFGVNQVFHVDNFA